MFPGFPSSSEIICNTVAATGTLITIPAGKSYSGHLTISATVAVAGTSIPTVSTAGTNVAPASGTVIGRINLSGLALTTIASTGSFEIIVRAPDENSVTLTFTAGASGTSSATINGYIY